jgi:transposase
MKIHKDVTLERVTEAAERHHITLDNPGFCICCGAEAEGVEPDARRYECEACGENGVYGADELLLMMA